MFCFARFWKVGTDERTDGCTDRRTDGRHVQKQLSLPALTVGRPSGSIAETNRPRKRYMMLGGSLNSWTLVRNTFENNITKQYYKNINLQYYPSQVLLLNLIPSASGCVGLIRFTGIVGKNFLLSHEWSCVCNFPSALTTFSYNSMSARFLAVIFFHLHTTRGVDFYKRTVTTHSYSYV